MPFAGIGQTLRVAVAANAQFVSEKLAKAFKQKTGIEAQLIVSSSGKLTTQIEQGAPFDVFLSADMKYPQELYQKKLTTAAPKIYAYGTLVIWSKANGLSGNNLSGLSNVAIKKIAIANPKLAPYGTAAEEAMQKTHTFATLKPKLVYGESIAQVNQYLIAGAVDAAFTAKSVVLDSAQKGVGRWTEVDSKLYHPIAQGVVVLKASQGQNLAAANQFCKFMFSVQAKQIFKAYGYR
ncbi:molybdate ABC transporter substrate-binding protein [Mucilaginibacter sp. CSA2-8R]|uniref:molybdate ABC transporter substrate-binding protein n=1 Tax=Mucilaginibacter sp. CSA2-8R TaxID=3141542 RepID=UPI00315C7AAF